MIKACPVCRGKKVMMNLGGIYGDCKHCLGVGHVKDVEPQEDLVEPMTAEEVIAAITPIPIIEKEYSDKIIPIKNDGHKNKKKGY